MSEKNIFDLIREWQDAPCDTASSFASSATSSLSGGTVPPKAEFPEGANATAAVVNTAAVANTRKRRKKKLPKVASKEEVARVLDAVQRQKGGDYGIRDRLMAEFMYRAGLRVSEVVAIRPRDVMRDGIIHLYDAKGGDGTAYFDPASILPGLDRWVAIRARWAGHIDEAAIPLFIKPGGAPVTVRYIQRSIKAAREELGITGIFTPHVLRHTFATELIEEGMPIHEVQGAMRHANLATTAVYLHIRDESLRSKISRRS